MFRGYEVGAVDYLMKPVIPEVLKSKVAVFVELFRKSERLRESEDKLRRLAAHLISIREEERAHIAREIHDELGQVLTGLKMEVTWLAKRLKDKPLIDKTDSMCALIDSSVQTVRKIATGLRPEMLDDMGLVAAVGWQAKEFQKRTGIRCRLSFPRRPSSTSKSPRRCSASSRRSSPTSPAMRARRASTSSSLCATARCCSTSSITAWARTPS